MKQLIKMCKSSYGGRTCIYHYVNPNQIVEIHVETTENEVNVEALLTSGQRMIILLKEDLIDLVGEDYAQEIMKKIEETIEEKRRCFK